MIRYAPGIYMIINRASITDHTALLTVDDSEIRVGDDAQVTVFVMKSMYWNPTEYWTDKLIDNRNTRVRRIGNKPTQIITTGVFTG